jgi:glycerol-3-phosphate dehydrogenase (NAD(P)+)
MSRVAILGGGSWGTALAILCARARESHEVILWVRDGSLAEAMKETRDNMTYLPGHAIPGPVQIQSDLAAAVGGAEIVVGAVPSAHARRIYREAFTFVRGEVTCVSATKGLEPETHARMSEVIAQTTAANRIAATVAVLSGPSFALEAARGEPTAVVLACEDESAAKSLQQMLGGANLRLYTNTDVLGVELAGAMKNVIAIAAGVCQGLGLGLNPVAALITRGLAEMTRLGVALGAKAETFSGLAGLGDLVLTCTGTLSRNRHVGFELGKGRAIGEILGSMRMVAEGVGSTAALLALAREHGVELPITGQVGAILEGATAPAAAIRNIMDRPQKRE